VAFILSFYGIAFMFCAFVLLMAVLLAFRRVAGRARVRASANLTDEARDTLHGAVKGASFSKAEMVSGDSGNPDQAVGRGALALFPDQLAFALGEKIVWRLPLADLTDMTRLRSASAFDNTEAAVDALPDYLLKLSWKGGSASFAVLDVDEWIAAIARAKP
jgi:hypothetical protein